MKQSVMNMPATYSTSKELIFGFMTQYVAWCEDRLLGFYDSQEGADEACKNHAICEEIKAVFA